MLHFEFSSHFDTPVETLFAVHEAEDALEKLTPPWQKVQMVSKTGGIQTGAQVVFRILAGPFHITWVALHTDYEKNRLFVDEEQKGPFRYWRHRHIFTIEGEGSRLTDSIEFGLPGGPLADAAAGWAVKLQLRKMFAYRHQVTAREARKLST
jgi:ligand-binding SRPBCC domain-containing protein